MRRSSRAPTRPSPPSRSTSRRPDPARPSNPEPPGPSNRRHDRAWFRPSCVRPPARAASGLHRDRRAGAGAGHRRHRRWSSAWPGWWCCSRSRTAIPIASWRSGTTRRPGRPRGSRPRKWSATVARPARSSDRGLHDDDQRAHRRRRAGTGDLGRGHPAAVRDAAASRRCSAGRSRTPTPRPARRRRSSSATGCGSAGSPAMPASSAAAVQLDGRARTVVGVMPAAFRLPLDYRDERPTELWTALTWNPADLGQWGNRSYIGVARLAADRTPAEATSELAVIADQWVRAGLVPDQGDGRPASIGRAARRSGHRWCARRDGAAGGCGPGDAAARRGQRRRAGDDWRRRPPSRHGGAGGARGEPRPAGAPAGGRARRPGAGRWSSRARPGRRWHPRRPRARPGDPAARIGPRARLVGAGAAGRRHRGRRRGVRRRAGAAAVARTGGQPRRRDPRQCRAAAPAHAPGAGRGAGGGVGDAAARRHAARPHAWCHCRRWTSVFAPQGVLTAEVQLPAATYPAPADVVGFYRTRHRPACRAARRAAAGAVRVLPLSRTIGDWSIRLEGRPYSPAENPNADYQAVTPGYFQAMGLRVVRGRGLTARRSRGRPAGGGDQRDHGRRATGRARRRSASAS